MSKAIQLPPKTKARLLALISQRNQAQAVLDTTGRAIDAVVDTARELMNIPDDWTMDDIDQGFLPPHTPPTPPAQ